MQILLLRRYSQGGKWMSIGEKLFVVGNPSKIEAISAVLSQEAQRLNVGDPVELSSIGMPVMIKLGIIEFGLR